MPHDRSLRGVRNVPYLDPGGHCMSVEKEKSDIKLHNENKYTSYAVLLCGLSLH